jgi:hypothetical protein
MSSEGQIREICARSKQVALWRRVPAGLRQQNIEKICTNLLL